MRTDITPLTAEFNRKVSEGKREVTQRLRNAMCTRGSLVIQPNVALT